mmetsp:Transcript_94437/g.250871  ORF Transcript_94437/g.250871 Transcript_94437/m.250871 type:complete len:206 (-) Transcript_94437:40-657(-)
MRVAKDRPLRGLECAAPCIGGGLEDGHARQVPREHPLRQPEGLDGEAVARHEGEGVAGGGRLGRADGRGEEGDHRGDQVPAVPRLHRRNDREEVLPLDVLKTRSVILAVEERLERHTTPTPGSAGEEADPDVLPLDVAICQHEKEYLTFRRRLPNSLLGIMGGLKQKGSATSCEGKLQQQQQLRAGCGGRHHLTERSESTVVLQS